MFEFVMLVLAFFGGLAPLIWLFNWVGDQLPVRKFCGFQRSTPLDVIITTSATTRSSKGAGVQRPTTGIGQVQGVSYLSKFLGRFYSKKPIDIHLGKGNNLRPNGDLVLLGGPSKNYYSDLFIQKVQAAFPALNLEVDDFSSRLQLSGNSYDISHLDIDKGMAKRDVGLVIAWTNPFAPVPGLTRCIYCSGLTSYGTSGAALWFFGDLLCEKSSFAEVKMVAGDKKPFFACTLNIEIINGVIAGVEVMKYYSLSDYE
jgi:hypothetical protein